MTGHLRKLPVQLPDDMAHPRAGGGYRRQGTVWAGISGRAPLPGRPAAQRHDNGSPSARTCLEVWPIAADAFPARSHPPRGTRRMRHHQRMHPARMAKQTLDLGPTFRRWRDLDMIEVICWQIVRQGGDDEPLHWGPGSSCLRPSAGRGTLVGSAAGQGPVHPAGLAG